MKRNSTIPIELQNLGRWLATARAQQGLSQKDLAIRAKVSQPRVSGIENALILPTLPQLLRLARVLMLPLEWFLRGSLFPGKEVPEFALELQRLGMVDLVVPIAVVPGAFRPTEQVLTLAVGGNQPEPRIIEAIPAVLAWNRWSPSLLRAYSRPWGGRASIRLAWLADVALTIHQTRGFPGGCPEREHLATFIGGWSKANRPATEDDLGRPGEEHTLPPVSKRWKIGYDAPLSAFVERAEHLHSLRMARP
jgi:transcriptional regulator with XRE-family HTH domain